MMDAATRSTHPSILLSTGRKEFPKTSRTNCVAAAILHVRNIPFYLQDLPMVRRP
jgi:hypothetical protein